MSRLAICLSLAGIVLSCSMGDWARGQEDRSRVGIAPGVMATSEGPDAWRLVLPGETLPDEVLVRTASAGPCLIERPNGRLVVAEGSRLMLDGEQSVRLLAGRLVVSTTKGQSGRFDLDPFEVTVGSTSRVELAIQQHSPSGAEPASVTATVTVLQGSAEFASGDSPGRTVSAGKVATLTLGSSEDKPEIKPVSEQEKRRILRWSNLERPSQGMGQLLVKDAQSTSPKRLNVVRYHAHVVLQPPVALVQIDQEFHNPYSRQEEGTFLFSLPTGASVSRFAMYVTDDNLIEGELIERQRASRVYQTIVTSRRDPAILEQIGDNLFKMRVFPVFANDTKRILLDYTVPIESFNGEYRFTLPLLSDLEPIDDFQITGVIGGSPQAERFHCDSHPKLDVKTRDDGSLTFSLKSKNYQPERNLSMRWSPESDTEASVRTMIDELGERSRGKSADIASDWPSDIEKKVYFVASIPSSDSGEADGTKKNTPQTQSKPADVLLLVDTSSAMQGRSAARRAARMVINNLRPVDRFRLTAVDVSARALHVGWLEPGTPTAAAALEKLDEQICLGGSQLSGSIADALTTFDLSSTSRRVVLYLGDGQTNLTQAYIRSLQSDLGNWNMLGAGKDDDAAYAVAEERLATAIKRSAATFHVGLAVSHPQGRPLLETLAAESGGVVFDLGSTAAGHREMFAWCLAGMPQPRRVVSVEVQGARSEDLFHSREWLPGRMLHLVGRCLASDSIRVKVTTSYRGKTRTQSLDLPMDEGTDYFAGRHWARRKLKDLLVEEEQVRNERGQRASKTIQAEILDLSTEWSLLTPFTAFLVLESEEDYGRWGIERSLRRRYWRPADAMPPDPRTTEGKAQLAGDTPPEPVEPPGPSVAEKNQARVDETIDLAQEALAAADFEGAMSVLARISGDPTAERSAEFVKLRRRAQDSLILRTALDRMGPSRRLVDPATDEAILDIPDPLTRMLVPMVQVSEAYRRNHPFAEVLLKEIEVHPNMFGGTPRQAAPDPPRAPEDPFAFDSNQPNRKPLQSRPSTQTRQPVVVPRRPRYDSLQDLVDFLQESTNVPVVLDHRSMGSVGVDSDTNLNVQAWGRMTIEQFARMSLRQIDLVLIKRPDGLLITSVGGSQDQPTTRIYPVADLRDPRRVVEPEALLHPAMDLEAFQEERFRKRLEEPLSVAYLETPLGEIASSLGRSLDIPIVLDYRAMEAVGVDPDTFLTANWNGVPAKSSLDWMLRPLELTYIIRDGTLVITTKESAQDQMEPRLYPAEGIVFGYPMPEVPDSDGLRQGGRGFGMAMGSGGFGMGGGGMAMAGFGGGMGMAMGGGFGGGMGGMGGPPEVAFGGDASELSGGMGLSSGGGDSVPEEAVEEEPLEAEQAVAESSDEPDDEPVEIEPAAEDVPAESNQTPLTYDVKGVIDLLKGTIAQDSWDAVGAPGSIAFLPSTFDLVVAQTEEVHQQIEKLLNELRVLPLEDEHAVAATREHLLNRPVEDTATLITTMTNLIKRLIAPNSWDDVGSIGSVGPHLPSVSLIISQTPDVHEQIERLLVRLRRRRYEMVRGTRPWRLCEPWANAASRWVGPMGAWGAADASRSEDDEPTDDELAAVSVRRVIDGGSQWERISPGQTSPQVIALQRREGRAALRIGDRHFRLEGDDVAIAHPDVFLVEIGPHAKAVRRMADVHLPWMPHRTNEQLAAGFQIEVISSDKEVRLRLTPRGVVAGAGCYLDATFSQDTGQVTAWASYVGGKETGRLRFEEPTGEKGPAGWQTVVQEDADGKELARWQSIEAGSETSKIPSLGEDWGDYIVVDDRPDQPEGDPVISAMIQAIKQNDLNEVVTHLNRASDDRPDHPLLLFVTAWCHEINPTFGDRSAVMGLFDKLAEKKAWGLLRIAGGGRFRFLSSDERFDLLKAIPPSQRTVADWNRIVRLAAALERHAEGLALLDAADIALYQPDEPLSWWQLRLGFLLGMNQKEKARAMLDRWTAGPEAVPMRLVGVARQLSTVGRRDWADELMLMVVESPKLDPFRLEEMWRHRARFQEEERRLEILAEAADARRTNAAIAAWARQTLLVELNRPDQAATARDLSQQTKLPSLRNALLLREAKLTDNPAAAAELYWSLHVTGRMPADGIDELSWAWARAGRGDLVIAGCEDALRRGRLLSGDTSNHLSEAYEQSLRFTDAIRALTVDPSIED